MWDVGFNSRTKLPKKGPNLACNGSTHGYGRYRKLAFCIQFSFAECSPDLHQLESLESLAVRFPAVEWLGPLDLYMLLNPQEPTFLLLTSQRHSPRNWVFCQQCSRVQSKLGRGPEEGALGIVWLLSLKWQLWHCVLEFKRLVVDS